MANLSRTNHKNGLRNNRKILVVGDKGFFAESVINHSIHLADRLGYDLVALSVNVQCEGKAFGNCAASTRKLFEMADRHGIYCTQMVRSEDIEFAVENTIHEIRRVGVVVIESETNSESIRNISVPIVSVLSDKNNKGDTSMVASNSSKAVVIGKTAGYGVLSAAFCAAAFSRSDTIAQVCSRGGWYAALPIATVMVFSFVHGTFAHNLWSALGIEAFKRDQVRQTEHKVIEKRKLQRKRPRAYAPVNPFHKMD